ncbi:hypothetical protein MP228_004840 [Amoeboaphelidium protococcarum]|nr:hypothetical protein MP228_004840 [Amoeboaphelidium protococcarum]
MILPLQILYSIGKYYTSGPPRKSWTLRYYLHVELIKNALSIDSAQSLTYTEFYLHLNEKRGKVEQLAGLSLRRLKNLFPDLDVTSVSIARLDEQLKREAGDDEHFSGKLVNVRESNIPLNGEMSSPPNAKDRVALYIHGGAHILMSIKSHRRMAAIVASQYQIHVLSIDYRLSPENPFPCALFDGVAAYIHLLKNGGYQSDQILLMGDSAGGHLALTLLLFIKNYRKELSEAYGVNVDLPRCACLFSPWGDVTLSLPSVDMNHGTDYLHNPKATVSPIPGVGFFYWLGGAAFEDMHDEEKVRHAESEMRGNPYVCPSLCGQFDGMPPMLLQCGSAELLMSDSIAVYVLNQFPADEDAAGKKVKACEKVIMQTAEMTRDVIEKHEMDYGNDNVDVDQQEMRDNSDEGQQLENVARNVEIQSGHKGTIRVEIYHEMVHAFQCLDMGSVTDWALTNGGKFVENCFSQPDQLEFGIHYNNYHKDVDKVTPYHHLSKSEE